MIESIIVSGGAPFVRILRSEAPVLAVALHAGHQLRPELEEYLALSDADRLREEDPHTARMAPSGITLIEVLRSRFEVDLNRQRLRALYQGPQDAWGMEVYREELPDEQDRASRAAYDTFYAAAFDELSRIEARYGRFVVLDLHSYNHRRGGVDTLAADPLKNPEVNLGTRRMDRERWGCVVDAFMDTMRSAGFDCRENVKFGGGHFAQWVAETFPLSGAVLAIEFKKTYMNEWTGEVDPSAIDRIRSVLEAAVPLLAEAVDAAP